MLISCSTGSMIAIDRPYIASSKESAVQTTSERCLEYGSATQLYLVPFVQHEEQVSDLCYIITLLSFRI